MPALHLCTVTDLRRQLTPNELTAIAQAVLGRKATDSAEDAAAIDEHLSRLLTAACDRVVASVNACESNPRLAFGARKVPKACVMTALVLARHALLSSVPGVMPKLEGSTRAAEYQQALADLNAIAACKLYVADYADSGEEDKDEAIIGGGTSTTIIGQPVHNWML